MIGKTNAISGVSAPVPKIKTVSGSVISISDALAQTAESLVVDINAVQNLNGYDSPWAGGSGKNLLPYPYRQTGTATVGGITWTINDDGTVSASGTATTASYCWLYGSGSTPIPSWAQELAGKAVTVSAGNGSFVQSGFASMQMIFYGSPALVIQERTYTIPSDLSGYTGFGVVLFVQSGNTVNVTVKPQIELGSSATSYAPYENICPISGWSNVNVYREAQYDAGATPYVTINLNGTVYGGSLDVTTGVLTVTHHFATYDGSENWSSGTNYYVLFSQPNSTGNNDLTQIANWLKAGGSSNYTTYGYYRAQANGAICVGTIGSPWSSVSDFKTALTNNPLTICYELATPQTVQLSPTTVQMLLGNNTIWSDSGDSELQYWARR